MRNALLALTILSLIGCTGTGPRISGISDPLEDKISISSEGFSVPMVLKGGSADPFFRGAIKKKDKSEWHQLYVRVNNGMGDWANWNSAVFLKNNNRIEKTAERIDIRAEPGIYGTPIHYEDIVINVTLEEIQWLSQQEMTTIRLNSSTTTRHMDFIIKGTEAAYYLDVDIEAKAELQ
ncbi:MAG: hypothetical protein PF630_03825 [Gammaproteobacteria bacterium]|jgi:hypothetical protein|nr:hypothetical protein [Gammaproteobacteria bacterium]